jgi:alginate O-acetyltransferase complex protein AlgJ
MACQETSEMTGKWRVIADTLIVCFFVLLVFLPASDAVLEWVPLPGAFGNDRGIEKPALGLSFRKLYRAQRWIKRRIDRSGMATHLIRANYLARTAWMGVQPSPNAVVGRNGWFYYMDPAQRPFYRRLEPFPPDELRRWQRALAERRDWLAARGCRYALVIAPNKSTIYPEHVPEWLTRVGSRSRSDQLIEHIRAHSDVKIIDLRSALLAAKHTGRIYLKTDTHWNELGTYHASKEILRQLSDWYPQAEAPPLDRMDRSWLAEPGGDIIKGLGLRNVLPERKIVLTPPGGWRARRVPVDYGTLSVLSPKPNWPVWSQKEHAFELPGAPLPRTVMFRDSFGEGLMPWLAEHFQRIVFVWQPTLTFGERLTVLDPKIIQHEKPDLVLEEIVERYLMFPLPDNPPEMRRGRADQSVRGSASKR